MKSSCTLGASCVLLFTCGLGACGNDAETVHNPTQGPAVSAPTSPAGASGASAIAGGAAGNATPSTGGSSGAATAMPAGAMAPSGGASGASGAAAPPAASPAGSGSVAGGSVVGAAGASAVPPPVLDPSDCPAPDAASTPEAIAALEAINRLRVPAGANCVTTDVSIAKAATAHCEYYVANSQPDATCTPTNPHLEIVGCTGFTGVHPWDRMKAAGFSGQGGGEVMYFVADPEDAVATWANSVSHRISMLDPNTTSIGYGKAPGCDTMDFGPGLRPNPMTVVVYPYDGQTNLPTHFAGQREVPMPPAPPSGWPSGSPITIYAHKAVLTEHVLTIDGSDTPIEHTWLDPNSPVVAEADRSTYANNPFMYANEPLLPNTKYRVRVSGTYAGGALVKEWAFTTGAGNPRGE